MERKGERDTMQTSKAGNCSRNHGFTLFELIIVLVLISMMLGLVAPRIFTGIFRSDLDKTSNAIIALVDETRSRSMLTRESRFMIIDQDEQVLRVAAEVPDDFRLLTDDMTSYELKNVLISDVFAGVALSKGPEKVNIEFFPNGLVTPFMLHLADDGGNRKTILFKPFNPRPELSDGFVYPEDPADGE
jgi:prepilin-type N-terminal cleavage/methylation domain-containing protein